MAPGLTGRAGRNESGFGRQADRWVPGAVDETGLVATFPVREGRLLGGQHRDVGEGSGGGPRVTNVTSGALPLIHNQASGWVAGAR